MAAVSFAVYPPPMLLNSRQFFFVFVFPYLLVVVMAYVGARVLFALGNEVRKARELGSYRLLERLGQGGMGEVWRARHRLLARPAAIKLIRPLAAPSIIGSEAASRFEREAQAIASLRSPHTVDLFDFGIADDGTFYYVMELLDGLDAERIVNKFGPMPAERVIHVIRQVCHSLSEAESISLVHRDIKPANIVLCRYGEDYDFVKVLDFGIVKAIHEPGTAEGAPTLTALTAEHVVQRHAGVHRSRAGARGTACGSTVPTSMGPVASRTGCSRVSSSSPATRRCSSSSSTRRRCRSRRPHGQNCRFRKNSMRSCLRAWPRIRRTGRRPRANCRAGSRPCLSAASGPRNSRGHGGKRISLCLRAADQDPHDGCAQIIVGDAGRHAIEVRERADMPVEKTERVLYRAPWSTVRTSLAFEPDSSRSNRTLPALRAVLKAVIENVACAASTQEQALLLVNSLTPIGGRWWDDELILKNGLVKNLPFGDICIPTEMLRAGRGRRARVMIRQPPSIEPS